MSVLMQMGFLVEQEVASLLAVDPKTLANWRAKNAGPPYSRAGNTLLYPIAGLREWIEDNLVTPQPIAPALTDPPTRRAPGRPRKQAEAA